MTKRNEAFAKALKEFDAYRDLLKTLNLPKEEYDRLLAAKAKELDL